MKVKNLKEYLDTLDPEEDIWYLIYDRQAITHHYGGSLSKFVATDAEWGEVFGRFELNDYTYDNISEEFGDVCSPVVKDFACDTCGELDRRTKVLNGQKYCSDCGEAKEVIY